MTKPQWKEDPKLIAEVKEKADELIHGNQTRQLVLSDEALKYLKKNLGPELTAIICSVEQKNLTKFISGKLAPTTLQAHNIAVAYVIVNILLAHFPARQTKEWLVNYNDYLYGVPAQEMRWRPEDVRMAAMHLISHDPENRIKL